MREVGVHLEEAVVALLQALLECLHVGRAQAELARPVHHLDVIVLARDRVGDRAGPVGRVVIDDHQVRFGERGTHRVDEARQVVLLVVSGGDDEGSGHRKPDRSKRFLRRFRGPRAAS